MASLPDNFTVCSWNLLTTHPGNIDKTLPQEQRLPSIAEQINQIDPDICGLYEVRNTTVEDVHTYIQHNVSHVTTYSRQEHAMSQALTSKIAQTDAKTIHYEHGNRKGSAATIDGVRIVASHLSYELLRFDWRKEQAEDIIADIANAQQAIIMGDFNCLPWQKPRRMFEEAGFTSVLKTIFDKNPVTFPTPAYVPVLRPFQQLIVKPGLSIDDIYIKGLTVSDAGLIEGESDHFGLWAKLSR